MPDLHTICVSIKRSPTSHLLLSMTYTCSHDSYILGSNLQSCRPIDRVRCLSGAGKCNMPSMSPVPSESSSGFPLCGTFWQCIRYHVSVWVLGGGKGGFHGLDSAVHAKPGLQDGGSTHDRCRPLSIRPLHYIESGRAFGNSMGCRPSVEH